ncbi:MAG: hypothetical protein L0229_25730 [Blastocatellia bacterium]|nr:hypothetical protein [Blastocatellia bacterium]
MQEAIVWLIALAFIALIFWAIVRENDKKSRRSVEEFERDLAEGQASLLRAGMLELDKFAGGERQKRAAVEYRMDEERGITKTGGKGDDSERTEVESDG